MIEKLDNNYVVEWDIDTTNDTFYKIATIDAENKDVRRLLDELEDELGIIPAKREWKSQYNSYVAYDYEPFNTTGWNYKAYYPLGERTDFMQYLVNKRLYDINVLENNYKLREVGTNEKA